MVFWFRNVALRARTKRFDSRTNVTNYDLDGLAALALRMMLRAGSIRELILTDCALVLNRLSEQVLLHTLLFNGVVIMKIMRRIQIEMSESKGKEAAF